MRTAALLLVSALCCFLALSGCGEVTSSPLVLEDGGADELEHDGGASDAHAERGTTDPDAPVAVDAGLESAPVPEVPPSCSSAAVDCARCSSASSVDGGPPYTVTQCRAVVACVLERDAGNFPLQSCHNIHAGGPLWGGLFCVRDELARLCPDVPR